MAIGAEVGTAHVSLRLTMQQYERDLARARAATANATKGMAANFTAVERTSTRAAAAAHKHSIGIQALSRQFLVLRAATTGAVAALGIREITQAADAWVRLHARLTLVAGSSEAARVEQEKLFQVAQQTQTPLAALAETYARVRQVTSEWGVTADQTLTVVKGLAQIVKISGANAQEGAAGLLQFTQGLVKGVIQGDELRSLFENLQGLFIVIGEQTGQTANEVLQSALKNGLAIETVFEALIKGEDALNKKFLQLPKSIEGAFGNIRDALSASVGAAAQAGEAYGDTSKQLQRIADIINSGEFQKAIEFVLSFLAEGAERAATTVEEFGRIVGAIEGVVGAVKGMYDAGEQTFAVTDALRKAGISGREFREVLEADERQLKRLLGTTGEIQVPVPPAPPPSPEVQDTSNIKYPVDPEAAETATKTADATESLREKIGDLRNEMQITAAGPTTEMGVRMKALADAASTLGVSIEQLNAGPATLRALAVEYANLATQAHFAAQEQQAIEGLDDQLAELRLKMRGEQGGEVLARQLEHLSAAASAAGMSIAELAQASPEVRNRAQAYVEEAVALDRVIARNEALKEAEALRAGLDPGEQMRVSLEETAKKIQEVSEAGVLGPGEADAMQAQAVQNQVDAVTGSLDEQAAAKARIRDTQAQINELVRQQAISEEEGVRLTALNQENQERRGRIESGSRLPDDIDAANIAASGLASTLTDLENLSLESLAQSFQDIAAQIAQAVIQALIFKAIMAGVGGAAPTPTPVPGAGAGAGAGMTPMISRSAHGNVFMGGHLKRMARGGFITKRPMIMPMATGGALIGEAGPEAVMPLKRMASGNLGVASEGGGGGAQQVNNIYANSIEPGTVSTLYNLANRAAPGAVVNARSRGLVRERKKPPF